MILLRKTFKVKNTGFIRFSGGLSSDFPCQIPKKVIKKLLKNPTFIRFLAGDPPETHPQKAPKNQNEIRFIRFFDGAPKNPSDYKVFPPKAPKNTGIVRFFWARVSKNPKNTVIIRVVSKR